jgi:MFS family permease
VRSILRTRPPPVVTWYRVYCVAMTLLYVGCIIAGLLMSVFRDQLADDEMVPEDWVVLGIILIFAGCLLIGPFLFSFFLRPKPWTWVYHLVLICVGLTSVCTLPASIMLLIFWVQPANREYFGKDLGYMPDYLDED